MDPLYRELFALVHDDARAPAVRLKDAMAAIQKARPRHQWTGVYVLKGDVLDLAAYVGPETPHARIPIGKGLCGKAVTTRQDLDIGDVNAQPEYLACSIETKSEAIALMWHKGEIVGQIDVDSHTRGDFGADAMRSLATAAHILAPLADEVRVGR